MDEIVEIPIQKIRVGDYEQRIEIEDETLHGLVSSISRLGLLYPCIVVGEGDKFLLLEGHRRLAACKLLGKQTVKCLVSDLEKATEAEVAFAGNFFRKDISPVELSGALKDCLHKETMTVEEIAAGFDRSVHWVESMVAIADWPADVLKAIHEKAISVSAAHNLALVTDEVYRAFLVQNAVEQGATARTTAAWLQAWQTMQPAEEAITAEPVPSGAPQTPLVPQAPCLCCSQLFEVNMMSHVPVCGGCIQILRTVCTGDGGVTIDFTPKA